MFGILFRSFCCCLLCCKNNEKKSFEMRCASLCLQIINLGFMGCGFLSLAGGLIGTYAPKTIVASSIFLGYDIDKAMEVQEWVVKGAVVLFWLGAALLIYGAVGFVAIFTGSIIFLSIFRLVVVMMMILEAASCLVFLLFPSQCFDRGADLLNSTLQFYSQDGKATAASSKFVTHAWDVLQTELECCGARNFTDHVANSTSLPSSCCHANVTYEATPPSLLCPSPTNPFLNDKGCYTAVLERLNHFKWELLAGCLPLFLFQLNLLVMTFLV